MKKKMFAECMILALMLTMMAGCASDQPDQVGENVGEEVDREIDISFDTCEINGAYLYVKEDDGNGGIQESELDGLGILAAEGETIGSALEHGGYLEVTPVLEGDVFEGWMEYVEVVTLDEFGFEESAYELLTDNIYTTEELLALPVDADGAMYVAKWAGIPVEGYFRDREAWESGVTTSGSFSLRSGGGQMLFQEADGAAYSVSSYTYWLEEDATLGETMGTEYGASLLALDNYGAMFSGWTLYEADSTFWNEEPVEEDGITCFLIDERDPSAGYDVLVNAVLCGEDISTDQLYNMSCADTNYYAIATWDGDATEYHRFDLRGNGGQLVLLDDQNAEYGSSTYTYRLEEGGALSETMGVNGHVLIGMDKDGAEFTGWTLYQVSTVFWREDLVETDGVLCFAVDKEDLVAGFDVLVDPVLCGENISTEELCHISCFDTGYYAIANWK